MEGYIHCDVYVLKEHRLPVFKVSAIRISVLNMTLH